MKRIVLILLLLLLTSCSRDPNELIMVTEGGFAPYEYYDNGEVVGVDVDIAQDIANHLGKKLVVKDVDFDSIINELNSGKADFAAAGMSITPERLQEVDFSIEYVVSNQVVIINKNNPVTVDELYNKKIAVQLGSIAEQYVRKNYPKAELVLQKKYLTMVEGLKSNKVDLIIMDNLPAQDIVAKNTNLQILDGYLFSDRYGIAVKKGNTDLLYSINEVLNNLIATGKIEEYVINHSG